MGKQPQEVFTLVIELGRAPGDGLPEGATGAALMCYASGVDEAEAVRETVAILKQAEMAPLDVTAYGTAEERIEQGHEIGEDERELMDRALAENSVVVAQITPFFDEAGADAALGRDPEDDGAGEETVLVAAPAPEASEKPRRTGKGPGKGAGGKGAGAKPAKSRRKPGAGPRTTKPQPR